MSYRQVFRIVFRYLPLQDAARLLRACRFMRKSLIAAGKDGLRFHKYGDVGDMSDELVPLFSNLRLCRLQDMDFLPEEAILSISMLDLWDYSAENLISLRNLYPSWTCFPNVTRVANMPADWRQEWTPNLLDS